MAIEVSGARHELYRFGPDATGIGDHGIGEHGVAEDSAVPVGLLFSLDRATRRTRSG